MANNSIEIYSIYSDISFINLCLNYNYQNEFKRALGIKAGIRDDRIW